MGSLQGEPATSWAELQQRQQAGLKQRLKMQSGCANQMELFSQLILQQNNSLGRSITSICNGTERNGVSRALMIVKSNFSSFPLNPDSYGLHWE